ncbi:MAG: SdrD B-like domain-containing protein [Saprospiraceae bacterium]
MKHFFTFWALFALVLSNSFSLKAVDNTLADLTDCSCPGNLLVNPSFEGSTYGWSWAGGNFYTGTGYQVCGSNNGYLYATTSNAWVWQQVNNIAAGTKLNLSFWAGTHNPNYNHFVRIAFYNASGGYISSQTQSVDYDVDIYGNIKFYAISATAPSGTSYIRVEGYASGDYLKIDQVCLTAETCNLSLVCESNLNSSGWIIESDCAVAVCEGDQVQLSVNPNGLASYQWTGPNGFSYSSSSSSDISISNFSLSKAGIYSVTATDAYGCTASTEILVGLSNTCAADECIVRNVSNTSGCLESSSYGFWWNGVAYIFTSGATFVEYPDGTAVLTGRVNANNGSGKWFDVAAVFTGRTSGTPSGSPKHPSCYSSNTSNWYYYTGLSGYISGSEGVFNLSRKGEAFQVGKGANLNENVMGASGWFKAGGADGDFNFRLSGTEGDPCVCNNVTSGGQIGNPQQGCEPSFDPATLVNISFPSGGTGTIEYIWLKSTTTCTAPTSENDPNWILISGATGSAYNPGAITETTCFIRCARRDGCEDYVGESNVITITVNPNPDLAEEYRIDGGSWVLGNSLTVCEGQDVDLNFQGVGYQNWTFVWSGPNGFSQTNNNPSNTNNDLISLTNITHNQEGTYTVTYTNPSGCSKTEYFYITVEELPSATVTTTNASCGESNGLITFAFADNPSRSSIEFSKDGGITYPLNFPDNAGTASFENLAPGTYNLWVRWGNNDCPIDLGNVTLYDQPGAVVNAGPDKTICEGESVTLTASATGGTGNLTYTWSNGESGPSITVSPTSTKTYTVTVIDQNGCTASDNAKVNVNPTPTITISDKDCLPGDQFAFYFVDINVINADNVTASAGIVLNNGNGSFTIGAIPNGSDVVITAINTATTCQKELTISSPTCRCPDLDAPINEGDKAVCFGETLPVLTVSLSNNASNLTVDWYDAPTAGNLLAAGTLSYTPTTAGTFYTETRKTDSDCKSAARTPVSLTIHPLPNANAGTDQTICSFESASLTASGGISYLWNTGETVATISVNPSVTTTYSVEVTDENGCRATDEVVVTVLEAPTATFERSNPTCEQENGTITFVFPDHPSRSNIEFSIDGGITYPYQSADNAGSLIVSDLGEGSYALSVRWGNDECPLNLGTATLSNQASPTVNVGEDKTICEGNEITLTATGSGNGTLSYTWSNGATGPSIIVSPINNQKYTVTIEDENGCTQTDEVEVFVNPSPHVAAGPDVSICAGQGIELIATVIDGTPDYSYLWSNGETTAAITVNPFVTTTYTVIVTDSKGCSDTDQVIVTVASENCASLGDYVWEDLNGNGIQDDGDTGVEGVTVNLKDENGEVIETTTGPDGSYRFTDLAPGTYSVQFELPSGYNFSPINVDDDALDSDADPTMNGMTASITLDPGENDNKLDAGIYQPASLGDYVWEDLNGNGIQDDGDTGVEGVTVNLKDENGEVIETTTTGPDGSYSFTDLAPGTYSVQFVLPSGGYTYSPLNVGDDALDSDANSAMGGMTALTTLQSGENDPTLDAGIYQTASLGDYVWEDLNGNGIQDDGDTGVEGVTVNLKDENGEVFRTTTTGPDGAYSFTELIPGTYSVQFVLPSGYQYSPLNIGDDALDSDADPTQNGMTATTTLASGENDPTLDAGIYQTASLGDYVWEDLNGNGIQDDGDTGVEGVTVNLKDESGDVIETTTTGPDGSYSFTGLDPGTYSVQFVLPSGYTYSPVNIGDDALDSDADPAQNGMTATTTLESGENDPTLDAGIYQTTSLGDYVWEDLNGNGIQDDGDTGVEGVTVNLKDESGEVIETTTTGPDGSYSFTGLDPGTYSVQFVLPSGYQYSPLNIGDDALDSDADPAQNGMTATTTLASGENDPTLDAGIYQTASLGDYVWEDLNGNGIQDDGDTGVEGVTVNLKDESGDVIETTTTGPDGSYSFTGLDPGTYSVQFVLPSGYQQPCKHRR